MAERQHDQDNPEAIVGDFFDSLDAAEAAESDSGPSVAPEGDQDLDEDSESAEEASEDEIEATDETELDDETPDEEDEEDLDPVEKRFRGLQSLHDRQMAEVTQQLAAMQQWAQQVYQAQLQQHQAQTVAQQQQYQAQVPDPTPEQLKQGVENDLVRTWKTIAPQRPDLVPRMIAQAREAHGNETADAMQVEYNQFLVQQNTIAAQQQYEQLQAQQVERDRPEQMRTQMAEIMGSVAQQYGDAFTAVQDDFIARAKETAPLFREWMDEQGYEITPDAIRHFLVDTLQEVRETNLNKQAAKPRKARKAAPQDHVEGSTSGERPEDLSPDQLAINEILEGARELSIDIVAPNR